MSQYIGIDLHKSKSVVTRLTSRGRVLQQVARSHANDSLRDYLTQLSADARIAVEATGAWMWVYELIDATTLAHLLRADLVPAALHSSARRAGYAAGAPVSRLARPAAHAVKNNIAAIISTTGLRTLTRTACGVKSRGFWLECRCGLAIDLGSTAICTLGATDDEIRQVSKTIETQAAAEPQARLLKTMPGIGAYSALVIVREIGDIQRVPDSRHLCSYAGRCPRSIRRATRHGWGS